MRKVLPQNAIMIPDHAQKVFSGEIFDVFQWPQKLFDESDATFEMLKRPDTIIIIALKDDSVVLIKEEQPGRKAMTDLPGGRADKTDASWEEAAKRELLEETGMRFRSWKLVSVQQPVRKIEWFVAVYVATDFDSQVAPKLDPGEKIEVIEADFEQVRLILEKENNHIARKLSKMEDIIHLPEYEGVVTDRD